MVVLKNEFNKEFFLTSGYKVKVLGIPVASEPGAAQTPQEPEPLPASQPVKQPAPVKRPGVATRPVAAKQPGLRR